MTDIIRTTIDDKPTHVALIEQVNLNGCMIRYTCRLNAKALGREEDLLPTLHHQVLRYGVGRYCTADRWSGIKRGPIKNCYQNATRLVETDPDRFIYMEGYGNREDLGVVVGEHAWVLDKERGYEVIDVTWRDTKGAAYLGIPFRFDYLTNHTRKHRVYGLLDTPWSRWPIRSLPAEDWLHPDADKIPRDFIVPDDLPDPTDQLRELRNAG